jgi:hypothetical protein
MPADTGATVGSKVRERGTKKKKFPLLRRALGLNN